MSATTRSLSLSATMLRALRRNAILLGGAMAIALPVAMPAQAQDEARIRKLEQEVKALQRKVFPGASGPYFEPEIVAPQAQPTGPSTTAGPVTDMLARMDAVESALQSLTAQVETNSNALRLMNARVDALESAAMPVDPMAAPAAAVTPPPRADNATGNNMAAMTGGAAAAATAAAVIEKPSTGDDAEDTYVYGYRLWDAKKYGAAREQLQKVVNVYPSHRRASWARNLIGRSWLDEGQPSKAGEAFLQNYLADRSGERAPDSLLYLSRATLALGNKAKSCEALAEFRRVYPAEAAGRLSSLNTQTGREAGC
ncbi:tol-pal system YbgF family protein [Croceicoccus sp. Ery15]|uniref:tetratricopeptide repeat protein n=1 Tax=Croceicoccus sp. Ery15 TaxID=1703338 RepID=UPI001E2CBB70|nr:hypothetical protein [Croceicoccus sp. Ery15]